MSTQNTDQYYIRGKCIVPQKDPTMEDLLSGKVDLIGAATDSEQANLCLKGLPLGREHQDGSVGFVLTSRNEPGKGHYFLGLIDEVRDEKRNLKAFQTIENIRRGIIGGVSTRHRGVATHDPAKAEIQVEKTYDEVTLTERPHFQDCKLDFMVRKKDLHEWLGTDDPHIVNQYLMNTQELNSLFTEDAFKVFTQKKPGKSIGIAQKAPFLHTPPLRSEGVFSFSAQSFKEMSSNSDSKAQQASSTTSASSSSSTDANAENSAQNSATPNPSKKSTNEPGVTSKSVHYLSSVPKNGTPEEQYQAVLNDARRFQAAVQNGEINPAEMNPDELRQWNQYQFILTQELNSQLTAERQVNLKRKREEEQAAEAHRKRLIGDFMGLNKFLDNKDDPMSEADLQELVASIRPDAVGKFSHLVNGIRSFTAKQAEAIVDREKTAAQLRNIVQNEKKSEWNSLLALSNAAQRSGPFADPGARFETPENIGIPSLGRDPQNRNRRTTAIPIPEEMHGRSTAAPMQLQQQQLPMSSTSAFQSFMPQQQQQQQQQQQAPSAQNIRPSHLEIILPPTGSKVDRLMKTNEDFGKSYVNMQMGGASGDLLNDILENAMGGTTRNRGVFVTPG